MKEFDVRTRVYFGQDALDRLKEMPYKRVLIIADPFVVTSGMVQHAVRRLQEVGTRVVFMDGGKVVEENTPEALFDHPESERLRTFLAKVL